MLSVVTWKWGTLFGPEYVLRLKSMLARHLHMDHRLWCVTDDPTLQYDVHCLPMFTDHAEMKAGARSCFRRLRMFDRSFGELVGERILHLDLDCVLVDDVTPLFDRPDPLVLVKQAETKRTNGTTRVTHNPSMVLFDAGVLHEMWAQFHANPSKTWADARGQGWSCSDMSIINDYLHKHRATVPAATWDEADGVQAYWKRDAKLLKPGARIVLFFGNHNPHDERVQQQSPWIAEHWK